MADQDPDAAPSPVLDDEDRRLIDALMAEPPAEWPQIIVVGDDAVSGIRPIRR